MRTLLIGFILCAAAWAQPRVSPTRGAPASGPGSGTVTSIATSCGVSGGTITTTGTIKGSITVDSQTGAGAFAIPNADCGLLVARNQASAVSDTIAQAGGGGSFPSGWYVFYQCMGAGGCTITPATSTIDGASSLVLTQNQGILLVSNGTNYFTERGMGSAPGINQLTGDATAGPGSGSQALTLATVNAGPGACGDATHVCIPTTNGKGLITSQTTTAITGLVTANQNLRTVTATFGDFSSGASAISTSQIACVMVPFAGTVTGVYLSGTPSGSVTVDVKTVAHTSWTGPASTSSITASAIPALSSATTFSDTTLTGWTTAFTANTDVCFYESGAATTAGVSISLRIAAN